MAYCFVWMFQNHLKSEFTFEMFGVMVQHILIRDKFDCTFSKPRALNHVSIQQSLKVIFLLHSSFRLLQPRSHQPLVSDSLSDML